MNLGREHIGLWYDPSKDGQGVTILVYPNGTVFMMWHLAPWPGLSDQPVWLSAQRAGDEPDHTLTLYRTHFEHGKVVQYEAVGSCAYHVVNAEAIMVTLSVDFRSGFSPPPPAIDMLFHLRPLFREGTEWV